MRPSRLEAIRPSLRDRRKRLPRTHAFWSDPGSYVPPVATNGNAPSQGRRWCAARRAGLRPSRLRAIRPSLRDRRERRPRTHASWSNPGSTSLPSPQMETPLLWGVGGVQSGGRDCVGLALGRSRHPETLSRDRRKRRPRMRAFWSNPRGFSSRLVPQTQTPHRRGVFVCGGEGGIRTRVRLFT